LPLDFQDRISKQPNTNLPKGRRPDDRAASSWRDALCRVRAAAAAGHHSITPLLHSLQCRWPFRAFTAAAAVNVGAASVPRFCRASGLDGDAALATDHRISRRWRDSKQPNTDLPEARRPGDRAASSWRDALCRVRAAAAADFTMKDVKGMKVSVLASVLGLPGCSCRCCRHKFQASSFKFQLSPPLHHSITPLLHSRTLPPAVRCRL
jgi:hypothetical protein